MTLNRRAFLGTVAGAGLGAATVLDLAVTPAAQAVTLDNGLTATWKKRLTGAVPLSL
jgi:hypothetical protein